MNNPRTNLPPGDMQLYDSSLPGLIAGDYVIEVTQSLPNDVTDHFSQIISQSFGVNAPQFLIEASEIHSKFPGDRSNGDFSLSLPYIVFETPTLPWERAIDNTQPKGIPWMALIIMSSGELSISQTTGSPLVTRTVREFLQPDPKIVKPNIPLSSVNPKTLDSQINCLTLSTEHFTLLTPRLRELKNLAHVREVNPSLQALSGNNDAWYSELLANRFPVSINPADSSGMENFAFVIALEGLAPYLVDQPAWPAGADSIQLAVLASWSFISAVQPGQTFSDLAKNIANQSAGANNDDTLLRIPAKEDETDASKRIREGYTALQYHTEPGDQTFAWYRGPFTPYPAQPLPPFEGNYVNSSQLLIYDEANGIFDTSYSAAWTIGRLTALSNPVFIDSLQKISNRMVKQSAQLLQRSGMPHLAEVKDLKELSTPGLTRKIFISKIRDGMGSELTASFRARLNEQSGAKVISKEKNFLFPNEDIPVSPSAKAKWFLSKPEIINFLVEENNELLEATSDWLSQLVLLENIPFSNLVPDQRMLKQESIRFFTVDPGWLKALFDGAMSIGINSSQTYTLHSIISPRLWDKTVRKAAQTRSKLMSGYSHEHSSTVQLPLAGMLLRSALVSGWPGLQVDASVDGKPVNILRIDHLSPTVLIVLWDRIPDTVYVKQPQQGFTYGAADGWLLPLRSLAASNLGATTGTNFPLSGNLTQYMRVGKNGQPSNVLNLVPETKGQSGYLIPDLTRALDSQEQLTASQLAIELIRSPEAIQFMAISKSKSKKNADGK